MKKFLLIAALIATFPALAADTKSHGNHGLTVPQLKKGAANKAEGLNAWSKIYRVAQHPRCANCHVDERNIPMWSGLTRGDTARPHGMNINAGVSRIGAERLPCQTCHATSTRPNTQAHAAPHTGIAWQLAPVEFVWFGVSSADLCRQMRDPARNGGRNGEGLIEHIVHDASVRGFIAWGFDPGAGREPAPGTLQEHLNDLGKWVSAGMPCPDR